MGFLVVGRAVGLRFLKVGLAVGMDDGATLGLQLVIALGEDDGE